MDGTKTRLFRFVCRVKMDIVDDIKDKGDDLVDQGKDGLEDAKDQVQGAVAGLVADNIEAVCDSSA